MGIVRLWNKQNRMLDKKFLFPTILHTTESTDKAFDVMYFHVSIDPAWKELTDKEKIDEIRDWIRTSKKRRK